METKIRYRVKARRRRSFWGKFSKRFIQNPRFKWVVICIAFVIGAHLNGETKHNSAYADGVVIINGIPEPSSVSLMVIGGAAILLLRSRNQSR